MNAATYHLSRPAQLQQAEQQQAVDARVRRVVERSKEIAQRMGAKLPQQPTRSRA